MRTRTTITTITSALLLMSCGGGSDSTSPGPTAASVTLSAGNAQVAPVSSVLTDSLAVLVKDNNDQPMAGVTVHWAVTGGGSIHPATSVTGATGIARAARTLGSIAGTAGATATVTGLPPVPFSAVGQVQGAVTIASNVFTTLTDTAFGTLIDPEARPSVKVTDQNGTPVAGVTVVWTGGGGGAVTTASVPTGVDGISTVGYTFGALANGGYQAHATVTGLLGSPVNLALTATAGAPTDLTKTAGDGSITAPGSMVSQTVKATDVHGNAVSGVTINWSAVGGGSVTPTSNTTGATGTASAVRTLGTSSGDQTTNAAAPSIAGGATVSFVTTAASIVKVSNNLFNPTAATIVAGDSVLYQWQGVTALHNITFDPESGVPADVGNMSSGTVWVVFSSPGHFTYQCTNHPGMTGAVTVDP